ncbi:MAG: hypothetical protein ACR2GC_01135 [Methyloceanibacter sp.]|uniref:hypothetical protein n=1 Tax=Methyloceanibacter sp. TaxID=1965321 RepID=UPI003D9B09FE
MRKRSGNDLRDRFLGWQCRIRQIAMRQDGGRPSPGMRPRLLDVAVREITGALTVLLVPRHPEESTAFFRFQVMKTADPRDLYERGLTYLQADYFQKPETFSDTLAAVLPQDSPVASVLIEGGACVLAFHQFSQSYSLPCAVRILKPGDATREAAIWHNRLFNPALPDTVHVVAFQPDWASAKSVAGPEGPKSVSL